MWRHEDGNQHGTRGGGTRGGGPLAHRADRSPMMASRVGALHFPIFVNLGAVPPLIIGDAPSLIHKIRLLLKFAPVVEVITDHALPAHQQFGDRRRLSG